VVCRAWVEVVLALVKGREGGSVRVKRISVCDFRCIAAAFGFDITSGGFSALRYTLYVTTSTCFLLEPSPCLEAVPVMFDPTRFTMSAYARSSVCCSRILTTPSTMLVC
jgi:hypothetical protein